MQLITRRNKMILSRQFTLFRQLIASSTDINRALPLRKYSAQTESQLKAYFLISIFYIEMGQQRLAKRALQIGLDNV
jgi:hypothetical protein